MRSEYQVEFGLAFGLGVVYCRSGELIFRSAELEWRPLHAIGQTSEFQLAVVSCVRIKVEFPNPPESVNDVYPDMGSDGGLTVGRDT